VLSELQEFRILLVSSANDWVTFQMYPQLIVILDIEEQIALGYSDIVFEIIQGLCVERDSKNRMSENCDTAVNVVGVYVEAYIELGSVLDRFGAHRTTSLDD
jgi:hypothetical protein